HGGAAHDPQAHPAPARRSPRLADRQRRHRAHPGRLRRRGRQARPAAAPPRSPPPPPAPARLRPPTTTHDPTHAEALDWLYAQTRAGGRRHPGRAARLLDELWLEPPPRLVRVVGTNGKGTVSHLIAAGLTAAGHRTGL